MYGQRLVHYLFFNFFKSAQSINFHFLTYYDAASAMGTPVCGHT